MTSDYDDLIAAIATLRVTIETTLRLNGHILKDMAESLSILATDRI